MVLGSIAHTTWRKGVQNLRGGERRKNGPQGHRVVYTLHRPSGETGRTYRLAFPRRLEARVAILAGDLVLEFADICCQGVSSLLDILAQGFFKLL